MAGLLQGIPLPRTLDIDITPGPSKENKRRLAEALKDMEATLRLPDPSEVVSIPFDEHTFDNIQSLTLTTKFGPLDILFKPEGTYPYPRGVGSRMPNRGPSKHEVPTDRYDTALQQLIEIEMGQLTA